jgi:hypothetical protein
LGERVQRVQDSRIQVFVFIPYPSAIFDGMETADLLLCEVKPYISSFGKGFVTLYIRIISKLVDR